MMKLYNTLTKKYEELQPLDGKTIKMYACGPTVYNYFHVGNARCFVIFDFLRRYLEYRGYKVDFAQNFTDIDDKMIKRAAEENTTVADVAEKYIIEYFTDACGLGINKATFHPKATENIETIIEIVKTLEENGYAYAVAPDSESENKDVYFSARKFDGYGKLSHINIDDLESGARIDVSDIKKDPLDFAVWKAAKPGEPSYTSPWGNGRPGWHIECSAMVKKYLGNNIDIHCGGQDLAFPHHENEIAQSEAYYKCSNCENTEFARFWLHNGYINVDGAKMSKSGNFFTVRDAAAAYGYDAIRYFVISSHYRSPVNYSETALKSAKSSLERIHACEENLNFRIKILKEAEKTVETTAEQQQQLKSIEQRKIQMQQALDYDFNTADGVSALFDMVRDINILLTYTEVSLEILEKSHEIFMEIVRLFGFEIKNDNNSNNDDQIEQLVEQRTQAKKSKNFAEADNIREKLKEMGVIIEDTPQGPKWKRI